MPSARKCLLALIKLLAYQCAPGNAGIFVVSMAYRPTTKSIQLLLFNDKHLSVYDVILSQRCLYIVPRYHLKPVKAAFTLSTLRTASNTLENK